MPWIKVMETADLQTPFIQKVKAGSNQICIVNCEGKLYAVSAKCPHAGGELSGGWCKSGYIVCPIHRYEYNLQNGRGAKGQGDYIDTFPVKVREDGIYVEVKKRWRLF